MITTKVRFTGQFGLKVQNIDLLLNSRPTSIFIAKTDWFAQAVHICMHMEVLNITFIKSLPESKSGGDPAHHNIKSPIGNKIWGWKAQLQKSLSTALCPWLSLTSRIKAHSEFLKKTPHIALNGGITFKILGFIASLAYEYQNILVYHLFATVIEINLEI